MIRVVNKLLHVFGVELSRYRKAKKSRKTKNLTLYRTATGNYYLPADAHKDIVANTIKNGQIFEEDVINLASKYIKPGNTVLDVGANFGQMSILFSNMVGDTGKVHSFDADDWVFEIFNKNIEANSKTGIIISHFGAVHNVAGEILIFPDQDFEEFGTYGSYGIDYTAKKGREVKTITIDSLDIQEPVSFMKIDIQGGDLQAMQGAFKTIKKNQMPILFEYEYQFEERYNLCFQDYVDFVQSINYKFHKVINGHNFLILPDDFSKLPHLKNLYADFNKLSTLPKSIFQLTNLEELFLNGNKLIPLSKNVANLSNLKVLALMDNQLTSIPESISQLLSLTTLNLANNKLKALPEGIVNLVNLRYLSLKGNDNLQLSSDFSLDSSYVR